MAQSVERHIGNVEVTGPIPVSSFIGNPESLTEDFRDFFLRNKKGYSFNPHPFSP